MSDIVGLRTLHGSYFFVLKESKGHLEPVRLYAIICIDKTNNFCTRISQFQCFIECAGLVSLELIKMIKTDMSFPEFFHEILHWPPDRFIGRVVFDDDKLIVCIVELEHMLDCPDEHLWFLVIAWYMNRDKWLSSTEWREISVGEMMVDSSSSYDFHIVAKLVENTSDREEHERYIYPELVEVDIVSYPCFVSYHDDDIDEDENRE